MKIRAFWNAIVVAAVVGFCAISPAFARPADLIEEILGTPQGIPIKEVVMKVKAFEFNPKQVVVNQGEYLKLKITAEGGDFGFKIPGTNIKHSLKKGKEEDIVLYARSRGKVGWECSKFCGLGHPFMRGTIIIE